MSTTHHIEWVNLIVYVTVVQFVYYIKSFAAYRILRWTHYITFLAVDGVSCDLPSSGPGEGEGVHPGGEADREGAFREGVEHRDTSLAAATVASPPVEGEGGLEGGGGEGRGHYNSVWDHKFSSRTLLGRTL